MQVYCTEEGCKHNEHSFTNSLLTLCGKESITLTALDHNFPECMDYEVDE